MKKPPLALLFLVAISCAITAVSACGGESATTSTELAMIDEPTLEIPEGWVWFRAENVALALPDSFAGGDTRDPRVTAPWEQAASASNASFDPREYQLLMLRASENSPPVSVGVSYHSSSGYSMSMQEAVDAYEEGLRAAEADGLFEELSIEVEKVDEREARLTYRHKVDARPGGVEEVYVALLLGDSYACTVRYILDDALNTVLRDDYQRSADLIEIDEHK